MSYSQFYGRLQNWRLQASGTLKDLFGLTSNRLYLLAILIIQGVSWWLASYIFRVIAGNVLILHYNVDFGIDLIGSPNLIFYFPLLGALLLLLSLVALIILGSGRNFKIQSHFLLGGTFLSNLGILSALVLIYLVNFR
jgi:hypothetical protein